MGIIQAGKLDRRVTLLKPVTGGDNGIEVVPGGHVPAGSRWAAVIPEYRAEKLEAMGQTGKKVIRVWLRWESLAAQVTAHWALKYQKETYELVGAPTEIGRREGVELVAVASDIEVDEE